MLVQRWGMLSKTDGDLSANIATGQPALLFLHALEGVSGDLHVLSLCLWARPGREHARPHHQTEGFCARVRQTKTSKPGREACRGVYRHFGVRENSWVVWGKIRVSGDSILLDFDLTGPGGILQLPADEREHPLCGGDGVISRQPLLHLRALPNWQRVVDAEAVVKAAGGAQQVENMLILSTLWPLYC